MDDFLTYFLAGMLGEELLRKIATRPFGFWVLWLMGFILFNLIFAILFVVLTVYGVFNRPVNQSILNFLSNDVYETFIFVLVEILPWATLFSLGMGLLFALGYRLHYRRNIRDKLEKS